MHLLEQKQEEISALSNPASFEFRTADLQQLHGFVAGAEWTGDIQAPIGKGATSREDGLPERRKGEFLVIYLTPYMHQAAPAPIPFPHISPRSDCWLVPAPF